MITRAIRNTDITAVSSLIRQLTIDHILPDCSSQGADHLLASLTADKLSEALDSGLLVGAVIEEQGTIVGYAAIKEGHHLMHLFVDDEYQRRGIARRLFHFLVREFELKQVSVNASLNALQAYQKLGFIKQQPPQSKNGIPYIPMHWRASTN